nr:TPA_asm: photosystem I subunit I [Corydalis solida]
MGLVVPGIAMASLSLHLQKNKILSIRWKQIPSSSFKTCT